ncbi:hypothetical protein EZV62_008796 [Acer yangbiense]|uniref:Glycoside hydrolase family 13 N-terminal domain-containing protein n=1 Tax=Acer yangbiense TaxID=1000413 RepID=A0A5C7IEE8_9ROSI|nr:hypothetical protein EZV62_008796 [Acer yangbiense]
MTSLSLKTRISLHPNNSTLHFLPQNKLQSVEFSKKVKVKTKITCSATDQPQKKYSKKKRSASEEDKGIDPVGFLMKLGISHKFFAQFLRERHKALKDLKAEIFKRFLNLQELSTGYEIVGVHRNPEHRMDFMDWAPGARYCALVGDFNGWSPTENCAREGHFGHDDYGYWFISLEDKLREGEKPDELYFQQYNYVDDYDKGDSGVTIEEIFKKANDEYWEPEENETVKNQTRYKAWKEQHKDDPPSSLPPLDIIDNGKVYDIFNIPSDPVWFKKFRSKEAPIAYWLETRKGREGMVEELHTSYSSREQIQDEDGQQGFAIHWDPPPEYAY